VQRQLIADVPYDFLWQMREIDVLPSDLAGYDGPLPSPVLEHCAMELARPLERADAARCAAGLTRRNFVTQDCQGMVTREPTMKRAVRS